MAMNLAAIHKAIGNEEDFSVMMEKARTLMPADDWYHKAAVESICGNIDKAFEYLRFAAEQSDFDVQFAMHDPDLEPMRDDPRLGEITQLQNGTRSK